MTNWEEKCLLFHCYATPRAFIGVLYLEPQPFAPSL
jgi:hypothetical protein